MGEKKEKERERKKRERKRDEKNNIISNIRNPIGLYSIYSIQIYSIYSIVQVQRTLNERVDNILRGTHEPRPMAH